MAAIEADAGINTWSFSLVVMSTHAGCGAAVGWGFILIFHVVAITTPSYLSLTFAIVITTCYPGRINSLLRWGRFIYASRLPRRHH